MVLLLWGIVLVLAAGLGMRWVSGKGVFDSTFGMHCRITWREFAIGAAICGLLIVPLTVFTGGKIARGNLLKYKEWWNGYELAVNQDFRIPCTRDGSCDSNYSCDPYTHVHHESRQVASGKDADGNTTYRTEYYTENHTHHHQCPYATEEWGHEVTTSFGAYALGRTFSDNPQEWRSGSGIPSDRRRGHPEQWVAARDRIAAKDPGPVTKRMEYDNFIFASQSTILKQNSSSVERYRRSLPTPAKDLVEPYYANKFYPIGVNVDKGVWNYAVGRFGAALGSGLQGDFHLVMVSDRIAPNPAEYTNALHAFWTAKELGRNTISKNGLVVVIGTDGQTVTWARAFTGMPRGNEGLLTAVQHLKGESLSPDSLLGKPVGQATAGGGVKVVNGDGKLETMVWKTNRFARVRMRDFSYLNNEIQPTSGQKGWILVVAFLLCAIVWGIFIAVGHSEEETSGHSGDASQAQYPSRPRGRGLRARHDPLHGIGDQWRS